MQVQFNKTIDHLIKQHQLSRLLVAVSGGPDSVCLLHLLTTYLHTFPSPRSGRGKTAEAEAKSEGRELELYVAHLHHGLRGEEADLDQQLVIDLAKGYNLPVRTTKLDIKQLADQQGKGFEETARRARYSYFAKLLEQNKLDAVVTGHTLDDQAETIIMNFIRGAGPDGLSGMSEYQHLPLPDKEEVRILRPLLDFTREQILEYLKSNDLPYRIDRTNEDPAYTRNYIRHQLIPVMSKLNPNLQQTLGRSAQVLSEVASLQNQQIASHFKQILFDSSDDTLTFDLTAYQPLPAAIRWGIIRHAFTSLADQDAQLGQERALATDQMLLGDHGNKTIELGDQIHAYRKADRFHIKKQTAQAGP